MIYEWKCRTCGAVLENDIADSTARVLCDCSAQMKRLFTSVQIQATSPFQPHFNHSVGVHVESRRDFETKLRQASDAQSERTGIDHNYQPLLPGDIPQPTRDDAVFETRNKIVTDTQQKATYGEIK